MYDLLVCGFPLPGNPPAWVVGHEFQMKDGENALLRYTITPDGALMVRRKEYDSVPDEGAWRGYRLEAAREWGERVWFHGDIGFYTTLPEKPGTWLEYKARFTNGLLSWIVLERAEGIPGMTKGKDVWWRDRALDEVAVPLQWFEYGITEDVAAAYLDSLNKHIAAVREAGLKLDVPREQLDVHDQSKFSLEEFPFYARNFFGDKGDPDGWARAWLHHIHHNPHHWNHWLFADGFAPKGSTVEGGAVRMPHNYLLEMVADWMGAGYAYTGSWDMTKWLTDNLPRIRLHSQTVKELGEILAGLGYDMDMIWPRSERS